MKSPTPQESGTTPKRTKTDWDAVQRDYRTGLYTLRELEGKHGADNGLISRKAKREGWSQDLSLVIKQATNARLVEELVSKEVSTGQQKVSNTVFAAAELNKQVILGHRKDAQEARAAMVEARAAVLKCGASVVDVREAATFASAVESLSRTAKNLVEIERKAFSLDDTPPEKPGIDPVEALHAGSMERVRAKFDEVLGRTRSG